MKKKILLALLAATTLTACGLTPLNETRRNRVPQYIPPVANPADYGEWYIEPRTCSIRSRATDFTLINDGKVFKDNTINLKVMFDVPVVQPPRVEVSEILAPVPVEGARRGYTIILAYDSMNAAHMLKDDTYLMVQYQPINSAQMLESSFRTRGLMFALADLAKTCEN
jgi:hypothetical protein